MPATENSLSLWERVRVRGSTVDRMQRSEIRGHIILYASSTTLSIATILQAYIIYNTLHLNN
jgi:hypothetical protein